MDKINLGCGIRFREGWENVDIVPTSDVVKRVDLRKPFPYEDNSFDIVYHSNVLEHFSLEDGNKFMFECYRICKPTGILRVGVPDWERTCRDYLKAFENAKKGKDNGEHEWLIIEQIDQFLRETRGGEMLRFLTRKPLPASEFILRRIGNEGKTLIDWAQSDPNALNTPKKNFNKWERILRRVAFALLRLTDCADYENSLEIGLFRQTGEVHKWIYDEISLKKLFHEIGFKKITVQSAKSSLIPKWNSYLLDIEEDGSVNKPDSFFMEAVK